MATLLTRRGADAQRAVAGDLGWDGRRWRRWDGRRWRSAVNSLQPRLLHAATSPATWAELPRQRLDRGLVLAVERQVSELGASVVYAGPHGTVLSYRRPVRHGWHALLTLLTGVWALVWLAAIASRHEDRVRLEIDRWGHVWAERLRSP